MISFLSVLTSVKDYVEITHKLLETDPSLFQIKSYDEITALLTYFVLSIKEFLLQFITLNWIKDFWSLPVIVPDITSAMISEISILDGSFHNVFSFLETPLAYGQQNFVFYGFEKFFIGFINSLFLVLPTSASHIITLRRFVMQGVEIGYLAGLGTIAGNMVWFCSIIFGWRFFIIPWLSFDIFRYIFGFILLVKYLWDCTKERRIILEDVNKSKIFLLNFLLALTEQTCIYPFLSNISISSEGSLLETFPAESFSQFIFIHGAYLFGIFVGSYSLLLLSTWFWEYPAFTIFLWIQTKSNYRFTTKFYYKILNNIFTYLTMLAAISSIPYYGLDYTLTKQLDLIPQDRIITQKPSLQNRSEYEKLITETSFLDIQPTNINLRVRDGQRPRRERWKQHFIKYEALDVSLYDQGVYDFLTIEDLNYGFDRFWFRRKMRNHTTHFRLFPGPWMRTLKKQLLGPGQEARRHDFFTLLFEQYYHPNFHKMNKSISTSFLSGKGKSTLKDDVGDNSFKKSSQYKIINNIDNVSSTFYGNDRIQFFQKMQENKNNFNLKKKTRSEFSALRKFVRKFNTRIKTSEINLTNSELRSGNKQFTKKIYSKRWKNLYANIWRGSNKNSNQLFITNPFRSLSRKVFLDSTNIKRQLSLLSKKEKQYNNLQKFYHFDSSIINKVDDPKKKTLIFENIKRTLTREKLSKKDRQILRFRTQLFLTDISQSVSSSIKSKEKAYPLMDEINRKNQSINEVDKINFKVGSLLHPLKFYLQKEESFRRKLKFYGSAIFRKLSIGNNAPYFRTIMKRGFYYYKKTLRWKRTENVAALRRGLRKTFRTPRKLVKNKNLKTSDFFSPALTPLGVSASPLRGTATEEERGTAINKVDDKNIIKPNHFYSNVGKRTSRYRFQIYKDVLQHWYYTPFNRLLLRFDIDAFINRQPKNHFLTTKEEQLLHLRRSLLGEHYDTLRWYNLMQNYRSMKTRIGSTKSFASRTYNQQFQGTFKKIRHLFAITPSQTNFGLELNMTQNNSLQSFNKKIESDFSKNVKSSESQLKIQKETPSLLKFDQPLYNEYQNSSKTVTKQSGSILEKSILHEELFVPIKKPSNFFSSALTPKGVSAAATEEERETVNSQKMDSLFVPKEGLVKINKKNELNQDENFDDLINKSTKLVGLFLLKAEPDRKEYIKKIIKENKYSELFKFLYLGQKTEGIRPIISKNQISFISSHTSPALTPLGVSVSPLRGTPTEEEIGWKRKELEDKKNFLSKSNIQQELWVHFLKESKKRLNNRKFMKKYINYRVTKREKRISQKLKIMKKRLQKLKTWLIPSVLLDYLPINSQERLISTRGLEKSFKKGALTINSTKETLTDIYELPSLKNLEQAEFFRTKLKIKLSLQTLKKVLETKSCTSCISPKKFDKNSNLFLAKTENIINKVDDKTTPFAIKQIRNGKRNIKNLVLKSKKTLKFIIKKFLVKSKPLYIFLKERPERAKHYFWKKRQKVKTKAQRQRKKILEKSIPEQKIGFKIKNSKVYYDNLILQEFPSFNISKQKIEKQPYEQELRSSLTDEGYQKLIPRFKNSDSISIFKNFIHKKLKNKHFVFREYKKKLKKAKRSEYYPRYFYDYSYSKLRKIKWISKQSFKEKARMMSKNKKLRILKNGGLFYTLIFKSIPERNDSKLINKEINLYNPSSNFELTWTKADVTKKHQPKKKKRKKRKFSIKKKYQKLINQRAKFNKRTIYRKGKLKKLGKQLKHIKSNIQFQLWWWQTYLPKFELNFLDRTKFYDSNSFAITSDLGAGVPEGYGTGRNSYINKVDDTNKNLFIGNLDFKPLNILLNNKIIKPDGLISVKTNQLNSFHPLTEDGGDKKEIITKNKLEKIANQKENESQNLLQTFYDNLLIKKESALLSNSLSYQENSITNSLPFYAGWDESSRKLVVTNRILSRRDAGFTFQNLNQFNSLQSIAKLYKENEFNFSMSPIFGLNEVSFLYWENEMPFTLYNIEQYNTNVLSFYAPVGWRRFEFRHSILKDWLNFIYKRSSYSVTKKEEINSEQSSESLKTNCAKTLTSLNNCLELNSLPDNLFLREKDQVQFKDVFASRQMKQSSINIIQKIQYKQKRISQKFRNRRIKTRNKRVKLASSTFVFKPQGPLLTDILPAHYLSVFNSQYRLPRHRYLKYKLIKNSNSLQSLTSTSEYNNFIKERNQLETSFTLRKRSKPKRKFHRKRLIKPGGLIFPRRRKFITNQNLNLIDSNPLLERWRPSIESEFNLNQPKTRVKTDTIRRRKLRRKMFKQIYKPIQRFQPRFGGYTWPGDYPRLGWTDMPKLDFKKIETFETIQPKRSTKEKRRLGMVGDLPHKYLLKKHNVIVLKKKLEKAQRSNKIKERVRELKNQVKNNIDK